MSGMACRDFELHGGNWDELLNHFILKGSDYYCNITRIDIANDLIDYDLFTIHQLLEKINNNEYSTPRFKNKDIHSSDKINSYNSKGISITFGSRNSEAVLQIYVKLSFLLLNI